MGSLNELAVAINKTAHDKGWYDRGIRNFGEVVALMHEGQPILQIKCVSIQELSEALEAWRDDIGEVVCTFKPDGIAVELIDCMIRCDRAPRGWFCLLDRGHDGPCPAWPRWWRHPVLWLRMHRWEMSKGARLELAVAQSCGFGIVYYSSLWNR